MRKILYLSHTFSRRINKISQARKKLAAPKNLKIYFLGIFMVFMFLGSDNLALNSTNLNAGNLNINEDIFDKNGTINENSPFKELETIPVSSGNTINNLIGLWSFEPGDDGGRLVTGTHTYTADDYRFVGYRNLDGYGTAATTRTTGGGGKWGEAVHFSDSLSDSIIVSDPSNELVIRTGGFTWGSWVYVDKFDNLGSGAGAIIWKNGEYGIRIISDGDETNGRGQFQSYVWNGAWEPSARTTETFEENRWYHVMATYDGSVLRTYVDGELKAEVARSSSGMAATSNPFYIGSQGTQTGVRFPGKVDDVRIYNRKLEGYEIKGIMNQEIYYSNMLEAHNRDWDVYGDGSGDNDYYIRKSGGTSNTWVYGSYSTWNFGAFGESDSTQFNSDVTFQGAGDNSPSNPNCDDPPYSGRIHFDMNARDSSGDFEQSRRLIGYADLQMPNYYFVSPQDEIRYEVFYAIWKGFNGNSYWRDKYVQFGSSSNRINLAETATTGTLIENKNFLVSTTSRSTALNFRMYLDANLARRRHWWYSNYRSHINSYLDFVKIYGLWTPNRDFWLESPADVEVPYIVGKTGVDPNDITWIASSSLITGANHPSFNGIQDTNQIFDAEVKEFTKDISSLNVGTHDITISITNGYVASKSDTVRAYVRDNTPDAPSLTSVVYDTTEEKIRLNWNAPAFQGSQNGVAGYDVYRRVNSGSYSKITSLLLSPSLTNWHDGDTGSFNANDIIEYYVTASTTGVGPFSGESIPSNSLSITLTPPDAPIITNIEYLDNLGSINYVRLHWDEPLNKGVDNEQVDWYKIYRSDPSAPTEYNLINTVTGTVTSYNDDATGFTDGTYRYKLSSVSTHWEGPQTDIQPITLSYPGTPVLKGNFIIVNGEMFVDWIAPGTGSAVHIEKYHLYRQINSGGFTKIAEIDGTITQYYDSGTTFTIGNTYHYKLTAETGLGVGEESVIESISPAVPNAPTWSSTPLSILGSDVLVNWITSSNFGTATSLLSYGIYRNGTLIATIYSGTTEFSETKYVDDAPLDPDKYYTYTVIATTTVGSSSPSTEQTILFRAPPDPPLINFATNSSGDSWVFFEWFASETNGEPVNFYMIYRDHSWLATVGPTILEYNDTTVSNGQTYRYHIIPYSDLGAGSQSQPVYDIPSKIPARPLNLALAGGYNTGFGDGWLTLTWNSPSDTGGATIEDYRIWRSDDDGNTYSLIATLGSAITTFTDDDGGVGLTNGQTYYYKVQAYNYRGWGWENSTAYSDFPRRIPDAPILSAPVENDGSVSLTWSEPYNGGTPIIEYQVKYRIQGATLWNTEIRSQTNIQISLENGKIYEFKIIAENAVGLSADSNIEVAIPHGLPSPPIILTQVSADGSYTITWNTPASNGRDIEGYNLYWGFSQGEIVFLHDLGLVNEYTNNSLDIINGQEYWFQLVAYNNATPSQEGGISNPFMIRPMANPGKVSNLQISAGNNQTQLSWDEMLVTGGSGINLEHYEIWRRSDSDPTFYNIANTTEITYLDTTTNNGHQYWYQIRATTFINIGRTTGGVSLNDRLYGVFSDESVMAEPKTIPNTPIVSGIEGDNENTINWNIPFDGGDDLIRFRLFRRNQTNDGSSWIGDWLEIENNLSPTQDSYIDSGLWNNQTYVYNVTAENSVGTSNQTLISQVSLSPYGVPLTIQQIDTEHSSTYILLNWTWDDIMANGRDAQTFEISRNISYDPYNWEVIATFSTTGMQQYTDYDVSILNWYAYRIRVENERGWSDYSPIAVEICDSGIPNTPYNVQIADEGDAQISISWNYNGTDGSINLDYGLFVNYKIYRGTSPGLTTTLIHTETNPDIKTFTDTGLLNGRTYYYTVTASNHYGESSKSSELAPKPYGVPNATYIIDVFPLDEMLNVSWYLLGSNYLNEPFDGGRTIGNYHIYRNSSTMEDYTLIATVSGTTFYFIDEGLTNGQIYGYKIVAENIRGNSEESEIMADYPCRAPHAPDLSSVIAIEDGVYLEWNTPDDGGDSIDGYKIFGGTDQGSLYLVGTTSSGTTEWTNTSGDFEWGNMHYYKVLAYNRKGDGDLSNINQAIPITYPDTPENFVISQIHNGSIDLSWDEPFFTGGNNVDISGYVIYYQNITFPGGWLEFDTGNPDTSATISNLINGHEYDFKISAYNNGSRDLNNELPGGEGANTSYTVEGMPFGIPDAPKSLTITRLASSRVDLEWNAPDYQGGYNIEINGFVIYRKDEVDDTWEIIRVINDKNTLTYSDRNMTGYNFNLTNGIHYSYRVSAFNNNTYLETAYPGGESPYSSTVVGRPITIPDAPENIEIWELGNQFVNITWESPTFTGGVNVPIEGYVVYRMNSTELIWREVSRNASNEFFLYDTGLTNGVYYYYRITAWNNDTVPRPPQTMNPGGESVYSIIKIGKPITTPTAPQNLDVEEIHPSLVILNWSAPLDDGGDSIDGFILYRKIGDGDWNQFYIGPISDFQGLGIFRYEDHAVTNGVEYSYKVVAINNRTQSDIETIPEPARLHPGGLGEESNHVKAKPFGSPSEPRNFVATSGEGFIELNWQVPSDPNGDSVDGYVIYRGTDTESLSFFANVIGGSITTYIDYDIEHDDVNGLTYYYKIAAYNNNSYGEDAYPGGLSSNSTNTPFATPMFRVYLQILNPSLNSLTGVLVNFTALDGSYSVINTTIADGWVSFGTIEDISKTYRILIYDGDWLIYNATYDILMDSTDDFTQSSLIVCNLSNFLFTLEDLEGEVISDAIVYLEDSNSPEVNYTFTTNETGQFEFWGIYNGTWNIMINYTNVGDSFEFTLNNTQLIIDTNLAFNSQSLIGNLTTITVDTKDYQALFGYDTLIDVEITLYSPYLDQNVTTLITNSQGQATFRLPETEYEFFVYFSNRYRDFNASSDEGGVISSSILSSHIIDIKLHKSITLYLAISETSTTLIWEDYAFDYPDWGTHDVSLSEPYYIELYYGDTFNATFFWRNNRNLDGIELALNSQNMQWTITLDSSVIAESETYTEDYFSIVGDGYYNFTFNTQDIQYPTVGNYLFHLRMGNEDYINSTIQIQIRVFNITAQIDTVDFDPQLDQITIQYGEDINLDFELISHLTNDPCPIINFQNITNAELYWRIDLGDDTIIQGGPLSKTYIQATTATYSFTESFELLGPGTYQLYVYGNEQNYDWIISQPITIIIQNRSTTLETDIPEEFRVSNQDMTVAFGENVTISIHYFDTQLSNSLTEGVDFEVFLNGVDVSQFVYEHPTESGWFMLTFPLTDVIDVMGYYALDISVSLANHTLQERIINVFAIESWNTALQLIEPPKSAIWAENVSFTVYYESIQSPRIEYIENANVSQIDIYAYIDGTSVYQFSLYLSTQDVDWGYTEMGGGFYEIWFNSSVLSLNQRTMFYIYPIMNHTVYQNGTVGPYIWVSTLASEVLVSTPYMPFSETNFNLLPNEYNRIEGNELIRIDYSVIQPGHYYDGLDISGAQTKIFSITNITDGSIIQSGTLNEYSGYYGLILFNDKLGQFRISFEIQKDNYQLINYSFIYEVTQDIEFDLSINSDFRFSSNTIKSALNEEFIFYVNITEGTVDNPSVEVFINGIGMSEEYIINSGTLNRDYTVTIPAIEIGLTANSIIEIVVSEDLFNTQTKYLNLIIEETWQTTSNIFIEGAEFYLGENISFYISYQSSIDTIRYDVNMSDAEILSLNLYYLDGANRILQHEFSQSSLATNWNYNYELFNDEFDSDIFFVWFDSSVLNLTGISESSQFAIEFVIAQENYAPQIGSENVWIRPIETILQSLQGDVVQMDTENSRDFEFLLRVREDEMSPLAGNILEGAIITYSVRDGSTILYSNNEFVELGEGIYSITLDPTLIAGFIVDQDYTLTIYSSLDNFTNAELQVGIQVLPGTVFLNINFDELITVNPTTMQAAIVETIDLTIASQDSDVNIELWLQVPGDEDSKLDLTSYLGIPQPSGDGELWTLSIPVSEIIEDESFGIGEYYLIINGSKTGYISSYKNYNLKIIDAWPSDVELVNPAQIRPWNSIVSMIIRYYGTQSPRNMVISGATISILEIDLIDNVGSINQLTLDSDDFGIWGYDELVGDSRYGEGFYRIWFNTSYLDIPEIRSFYIIPTFITPDEIFENASISPYLWVRPAYTSLELTSNISPELVIDGIVLELNQTDSITVNYLVSDSLSVMNGDEISNAVLNYTIIKDSDNSIFKTGLLTSVSGSKNYEFDLTGLIVGNYTILVQGSLMNYEDAFAEFRLVVKNRTLSPTVLYNRPETNEFVSPQNRDLNITVSVFDFLSNEKLSGATLTVKLMVGNEVFKEFTFTDSLEHEGDYYIIIPQSTIEELDENRAYRLLCSFSKANYTTVEDFQIFIQVGFRVDPVFGVPYRYWIIAGLTLGAMIGIVLARRAYVVKTTPTNILHIREIRKKIKKSKKIADSKYERTPKEEMYELFWKDFKILGIDMAEALGLEGKHKKFNTSADEELADINEEAYESLIETSRSDDLDETVDELMNRKQNSSNLMNQVKDSEDIDKLLNIDIEEIQRKMEKEKPKDQKLEITSDEDLKELQKKMAKDTKKANIDLEDEELDDFLNMDVDDADGDDK